MISPLLANLFLHYAFDAWMQRTYPDIPFERYADDVIIHAKSQAQAEQVLAAVRQRLRQCRLELHPEKTQIVYCQDSDRKGQHEHIQFELPPALLQNETRRALAELVQRNRERGVTDEMLKEKEKELIDGAAGLAANRLKTNFILHRIAEHESIQVKKEDLDLRIKQEAARYDISPEKMRKELQQKSALDDLAEQILLGKTLDFLKANVSIEPVEESTVKEEKA